MAYSKHKRTKGIRITRIDRASPAYAAGLRKDHTILTVNGKPIEDDLDFSFWSANEKLAIESLYKNKLKSFEVTRKQGELLDIEFAAPQMRRCSNRCIFCFIDQLPNGLRKSLYIKDEDYRYSFLNGNYITLSSVTKREMDKIIQLGLSPLYISVHATDRSVREKMLNNPNINSILDQLKILEDNGISFHTQIVVCPDINDGKILEKTLHDLLLFKNCLLSIAVVPVGLTKHRKTPLKPVAREDALKICRKVDEWSEQDKKTIGSRRLFIADEFLIKAGRIIPENQYYEKYPQIENGVGLIRLLLKEWEGIKRKLGKREGRITGKSDTNYNQEKKHYLILTSASANPYIKKIVSELGQFFNDLDLTVEPVPNKFFGESVTVAGLITARDIISTVHKLKKQWDSIIIPRVILNYREYTLDGFSISRIAKKIGRRVVVVENLSQLVDFLYAGKNAESQ